MVLRLALVLAFSLPALQPQTPVLNNADRRVLVIHSYRSGYEWTDELTKGLVSALNDSDFDVRTDIEFMDSARRPGESSEFAERLRRRYGRPDLHAVVAFDDAAVELLASREGDLFPGIPVVFGGLSNRELLARLPERFCGVEEAFEIRSTIDLALRLHPRARNLYLVLDETPFSKALAAVFAEVEPEYPRLRFIRLDGARLGREMLYSELRQVSEADPVFLISFVHDSQGHVSQKKMLASVATASPGPVWAIASSQIGQGLLAGRMNGGERHGQLVAERLLRVLRGEAPRGIGTAADEDSPLIFDRRQLDRRGVAASLLPPDAIVLHDDLSAWGKYRWWILGGAGFLILQSLLIAALVRNIFRRRRAEEALTKSNGELAAALRAAREADEAKGRFLANMSHEIRTPMNGVLGTAELLADSPLSPDQRESVETIRDSAAALLNLLNDLLDLSRLDAGYLAIEEVVFSPNEVMAEVIRLMGPQARRDRLQLASHIAPGVPSQVRGDALRIRQVLLNLTGNALKFTPHGRVDLSLGVEQSAGGASLRFEVADTGPGIPPTECETIFLRFRQLDTSAARRYGGAGLGLSIAKELVEAMGGEIGVESKPGQGCRFWFTIPAKSVSDRTEGVASSGAVQVR